MGTQSQTGMSIIAMEKSYYSRSTFWRRITNHLQSRLYQRGLLKSDFVEPETLPACPKCRYNSFKVGFHFFLSSLRYGVSPP